MNKHRAGQHDYDDDFLVADLPPKAPVSPLRALLDTVAAEHPNQWVRIRLYKVRNSAWSMKRQLNATEGWEAETRNEPGVGAWLWVRFVGDCPPVIHHSSTATSLDKEGLSTRSPQEDGG